jgi:hypothetical protein
MTVTNPRGDPSLLETVVRAEHDRLLGLATEAAKDIPTPGVREQLLAQLRDEVPAHARVEVSVVGPELVEAGLATDAIDDDRAVLAAALDRAIDDHAMLLSALQAHNATWDDLLVRLHPAVGGERMAALGWQFTRAAEVRVPAPASPAPTDELFGPPVSELGATGTGPQERAPSAGGHDEQV